MDPCIKAMINNLRLPDPLKCFLAWILKYIVSVGPWQGGIQEARSPEEKDSEEDGAQRVVGA